MLDKNASHPLPSEQLVLISLLATILVGTGLLALPISRLQPIPLLDLFFTATSATCVTGLFTIPLSQFTTVGHAVILMLIQIGGLGLITMTLFLLGSFANVGLGTQLIAGHILEVNSWRQIKKILAVIVLITVVSELVGALIIMGTLHHHYSFSHAFFLSFFHSVSAFCNAGIDIFQHGLIQFRTDNIMLLTTMALMFIGGLGFVTWHEIGLYGIARYQKRPYRFSLHSRIVLISSIVLIFGGALIIWILEHKNVLAGIDVGHAVMNSLFYGLSFRGAGFLVDNLLLFQHATLLFICVLAFIGQSPGSTGSGVKVTTFVVFLATIKAALLGKTVVTIKGRSIPLSLVYRAVGIVSIGVIWILVTTFFLLITQPLFSFLDLFFESVSAFTCLGLTTGVTPHLTTLGKIFIMLSMMVGRIGSFTLLLAIKLRRHKDVEFTYPEERVMLG